MLVLCKKILRLHLIVGQSWQDAVDRELEEKSRRLIEIQLVRMSVGTWGKRRKLCCQHEHIQVERQWKLSSNF